MPPFRLLWTARTISYLGDSLSLVALMLHLHDATGEAIAVALLLLAGDFAPSLLSPFTGVVSDRFDLKRVMVVCELVQAGVVVVIATTLPSLPLLLGLVALRAVAAQVFQPAAKAAVPALVPDEGLERANSALGFGTNGAEVLGPLLAALLMPLLGIRGVLLADAATFVVSALVLTLLPRMTSTHDGGTSFVADARAGLGYIWRTPVVRAIALGFCAVVAFNGVDDVALVFLAKDTFGGGDPAAALLLAGVGIGLLVGYLLLTRFAGRLAMAPLLLAGLAVSSAGNLLTGVAWAVLAAFVMQTVRGIGIAAMDVGANTLLQRAVPAAMLGRVFGNLYGAVGAAAALSYLLGSVLIDLTSPQTVLIIAGTGGLAATAFTATSLRTAGGRERDRPRPPASPPD
jgi:MFS family permease